MKLSEGHVRPLPLDLLPVALASVGSGAKGGGEVDVLRDRPQGWHSQPQGLCSLIQTLDLWSPSFGPQIRATVHLSKWPVPVA